VRFEWDDRKAGTNQRKHGVDFQEALSVFSDPLARIFVDDDHLADELHEIIIGRSSQRRLLLVCFTERGIDRVRLISARVATRKEQRDYKENVGI